MEIGDCARCRHNNALQPAMYAEATAVIVVKNQQNGEPPRIPDLEFNVKNKKKKLNYNN